MTLDLPPTPAAAISRPRLHDEVTARLMVQPMSVPRRPASASVDPIVRKLDATFFWAVAASRSASSML